MIGSLSLSGADPEIVGARVMELSAQVTTVARQISRLMGYVPASPAMLNGLPVTAPRTG